MEKEKKRGGLKRGEDILETAAAVRCMQLVRYCECLTDSMLLGGMAMVALLRFLAILVLLSNSIPIL